MSLLGTIGFLVLVALAIIICVILVGEWKFKIEYDAYTKGFIDGQTLCENSYRMEVKND